MDNLSEKQLVIKNTVKELREMTSNVTEITSRVREILSRMRIMTSGTEVTPTISPKPDLIPEMPGQAGSTNEGTNSGDSEPKQNSRRPFIN